MLHVQPTSRRAMSYWIIIQYAAKVKRLSAAEMHQEARKRCGCRNQLETQPYSDPTLPITHYSWPCNQSSVPACERHCSPCECWTVSDTSSGALQQTRRVSVDWSSTRKKRKQVTGSAALVFSIKYVSVIKIMCPDRGTWLYRGADKSLARPGRKQAIATEDFRFHISYL